MGGFVFSYSSISSNNNGRYIGPTNLTGSALRSAILNAANWQFNDLTGYVLPQALTFILPVTLKTFTGKVVPGGHYLEWKVGSEESFSHYEVEMATDGASFTAVATIPGTGKDSYSFTAAPSACRYQHYRIKMVDIDHKFKYSNIIRLDNNELKQNLSVYPNPSQTIVNVIASSTIIDLSIVDMGGQKVLYRKGSGTNRERSI